ncbi:BTAD domain-containing putative transcriptional regulator [Actinoplanes sp. NPDC049265]|uniref:BTAD domain-containing putative transcriptional regulator n=1 Tax=Actinoplanes sp. NPDC049265 TaxID=3363902 RepID=UPI0037139C25
MRVRVLGRLDVAGDDGITLPATGLPRRARQVLSVLAARYDRIQSKDALADAVWGRDLPGNHVAALEHYVSVIRRRLQPDGTAATHFIVTRAGGYLFDTTRAWLDLADLHHRIRGLDLVATGTPERLAVQQEICTLAHELPFADDPYADWAEPVRNEVRGVLQNANLEIADGIMDRDPARALRLALAAIELDPFLEAAYQTGMMAAAALGRPDDALRLYERCRKALDDELGVAPSARTAELQRNVLLSRTSTPALASPPAEEPRPGPVPEAPRQRFLGRNAEIELLLSDDRVPVVHLVGPSGAGKTALLDELRRRSPARVGIGHGPASAGALRLTWLHSALADLGVRGVVPATVEAAMTEQRALRREELAAIADALCGPEPLLIAVDDAENLDDVSVAELAWLGRHCAKLRVVLTYRYPSQIRGRPIGGLGSPLVLRLGPLTETDLERLDEKLTERTGGIAALVAVAERGPEVTAAVAMQVARTRTGWMPEPGWEVLRLCAALGELTVDDLARLTGRPVTDVLACIDRLVHAHLLAEDGDGHVRHRSSLIRDAVAEQVSSASSRHLRSQLTRA